jgi:hypothetical protein
MIEEGIAGGGAPDFSGRFGATPCPTKGKFRDEKSPHEIKGRRVQKVSPGALRNSRKAHHQKNTDIDKNSKS